MSAGIANFYDMWRFPRNNCDPVVYNFVVHVLANTICNNNNRFIFVSELGYVAR